MATAPALELPVPPAATPAPASDGRRARILLLTEGTYPYALGGVSSWCDLLIRGLDEFDWTVLPIVAPDGRPPLYPLPRHARMVGPVEVWTERLPRGRGRGPLHWDLPGALVRGLLGWDGDTEAVVA